MHSSTPNFSPFPFGLLRRLTRQEAAFESALAQWCRVRPSDRGQLAKLFEGPVTARITGVRGGMTPTPSSTALTMIDPNAAIAEVRIAGLSWFVVGASQPVRDLAQRLLGGPHELRAPRPLTTVERSLFALAVAAALEDLGIAGEVWPAAAPPSANGVIVGVLVELPVVAAPAASIQPVEATRVGHAGAARRAPSPPTRPTSLLLVCPPKLALAAPPSVPIGELNAWAFEVPIVVARSSLPRAAVAALRPSDTVTVEPALGLELGEGTIGLRAAPRAMEAAVATGYVRRDMAVLDDAQLEVTVQLGAVRLTLRQLGELVVGQIIPLGRPLAGPYEVHAGGRLIGRGELVDVEGELGIRIVSLEE